MSHALPLLLHVLCFMITAFSAIEWCSCCKQCCSVVQFTFEKVLGMRLVAI